MPKLIVNVHIYFNSRNNAAIILERRGILTVIVNDVNRCINRVEGDSSVKVISPIENCIEKLSFLEYLVFKYGHVQTLSNLTCREH